MQLIFKYFQCLGETCSSLKHFTLASKRLGIFSFIMIVVAACQTPPTQPSGSPLPSLPGGSAGSPSLPSESAPTPPSPSSQGSESGSEGDSSESAQSEGEAGEGEQGDPPPGWEDDTSIAEGQAESAEEEGEVTFEESQAEDSEVSFEEPIFDDGGGLTQEELEELERELNESLGDFDEDIQREKTYAEERANDNADNEPLGGVGTFESYEGGEESAGSSSSSSQTASSQSSSSSSESSSAQSSSDSAENAGEVSGENSATGEEIEANNEDIADLPADIPEDIADDDIVARQIREAAENETDPQLKEKLWAEYRKYKNQ